MNTERDCARALRQPLTEIMAEIGHDQSRLVLDPSYEEFCALAGVLARNAA